MSLAEQLELEDGAPTPVDYSMVVKVVTPMIAKSLKRPEIADGPVRNVRVEDLPLQPTPQPAERAKRTVMHMVDTILDIPDTFDREDVSALLLQGAVMSLPGKLAPKKASAHPYKMNLAIIPRTVAEGAPPRCDVLKHFVFDSSIPMDAAMELCQGTEMLINYGTYKKVGARPFMYLFQRMGGYIAHHFRIQIPSTKKTTLERPEDIDAGYDWIDDECPRSNDKNQQSRWIDKELNDADSPIFGWSIGRVDKACKNLKEAVGHADTIEECPLYWDHFEEWFQAILLRILPRLDEETILFLGVPGAGKTLTQMILGFAMSRVRIWGLGKEGKRRPSWRVASDFDNFKNEAGRPDRSTSFDDGDLDRMVARKLKNYTDARKKSVLSTERYVSAKFVQYEFRTAADNKCECRWTKYSTHRISSVQLPPSPHEFESMSSQFSLHIFCSGLLITQTWT